jgi:hypothetical protein
MQKSKKKNNKGLVWLAVDTVMQIPPPDIEGKPLEFDAAIPLSRPKTLTELLEPAESARGRPRGRGKGKVEGAP